MTKNVDKTVEQSEASAEKDHGVLYIGMDLGTSRTAISASNGVRESMQSVVGYPKDHVARKVLGKDVLLGKEAVEKRLSLKFIKPLEKGVLKDDDADAEREQAQARTHTTNESQQMSTL